MTTKSGTTDLVNIADSAKVIPTITDNTTYTSLADIPANHWGYKQDTGNFKKFVANTTILENNTYTNEDTTTLTFGAKVDYLQTSGTYNTTLIFTTTANYAAYDINYYDGVNNTAGNEIATQENDYNTSANIVLNPQYTGGATGPTRSGLSGDTYTFIKWCDTIPTADANNYFPATVCSGNSYANGDIITIDPTQYSTSLNLYAYWDPTTFDEAYTAAGKSKTGSYYAMQDMDANLCHAVTVNEVTQLTDTRSGNYTYYIAKLKDDKCWMVQNLRLGTNVSSLTLTSADSNISASSWVLNNKLSDGKFPAIECSAGSCEDRYTSATYYYDGDAYYCTPVTGNGYVGCYYNWYTATAGSGNHNITPVGTNVGYKDVNSSICPKGWYLPSGGGLPLSGGANDRPNSDFNVLYNNYPSASEMLVSNPTSIYDNTSGLPRPGLLLSGLYYSDGPYNVAQNGNYWSRSTYSNGMAYDLSLNSSAVNIRNNGYKYDGRSIRCLAYGS